MNDPTLSGFVLGFAIGTALGLVVRWLVLKFGGSSRQKIADGAFLGAFAGGLFGGLFAGGLVPVTLCAIAACPVGMAAAIFWNTILTGACLGAWLLSIVGGIIAGSTDGAGLFEVTFFTIGGNAVGVFAGAALAMVYVFFRWLVAIANPHKMAAQETFEFPEISGGKPDGASIEKSLRSNSGPEEARERCTSHEAVFDRLVFAVAFLGHYIGAIGGGIIGVNLFGVIGAFFGVVLGIALGALVPVLFVVCGFKLLRKVITFS